MYRRVAGDSYPRRNASNLEFGGDSKPEAWNPNRDGPMLLRIHAGALGYRDDSGKSHQSTKQIHRHEPTPTDISPKRDFSIALTSKLKQLENATYQACS